MLMIESILFELDTARNNVEAEPKVDVQDMALVVVHDVSVVSVFDFQQVGDDGVGGERLDKVVACALELDRGFWPVLADEVLVQPVNGLTAEHVSGDRVWQDVDDTAPGSRGCDSVGEYVHVQAGVEPDRPEQRDQLQRKHVLSAVVADLEDGTHVLDLVLLPAVHGLDLLLDFERGHERSLGVRLQRLARKPVDVHHLALRVARQFLLNGGRNRLIESDGEATSQSTTRCEFLLFSPSSRYLSAAGLSITLSGLLWTSCLIGLSNEYVLYLSTRLIASRPSIANASARMRSVGLVLLYEPVVSTGFSGFSQVARKLISWSRNSSRMTLFCSAKDSSGYRRSDTSLATMLSRLKSLLILTLLLPYGARCLMVNHDNAPLSTAEVRLPTSVVPRLLCTFSSARPRLMSSKRVSLENGCVLAEDRLSSAIRIVRVNILKMCELWYRVASK
ncbi:hypothetical protein OGAPHI_004615 [Ogataea philodendri]|uniref:Uncharacterized protein n=1 Tax=Ogataea philodendri TaxID=1378263 RepID=A0A9P8T2X0_9ASCO|nr:uncharacterized protein OGAPHI_004615 [Ogataea philodendri]KAH3664263.1 hypothetical protein OGAPHI_004615 [Ogataea philodendri]